MPEQRMGTRIGDKKICRPLRGHSVERELAEATARVCRPGIGGLAARGLCRQRTKADQHFRRAANQFAVEALAAGISDMCSCLPELQGLLSPALIARAARVACVRRDSSIRRARTLRTAATVKRVQRECANESGASKTHVPARPCFFDHWPVSITPAALSPALARVKSGARGRPERTAGLPHA